jgi:zinc transport system substrate-binding protein
MRHLFTAALVCFATPALAEVPRVVATTKPVHSLVAAVMGELGTPALIVKGAASPHTYSLRPSDAGELEAAGVVFWTGHGMELFLEGSIETLAPDASIVALSEAPGIVLLPTREGGAFEAHDDEGEGHGHEAEGRGHEAEEHEGEEHEHEGEEHDHDAHGERDMHFWLDPANAALMVSAIAETLAAADPENAQTYAANAARERAALEALTVSLDARLAPVRDKPFIVFHDAYQYFERRFGLSVAGSITVTPDSQPSARRVDELRNKLVSAGAVCVFAEPQFEPAIVQTIIAGTPARGGTLDPEGAGLSEGPGLYATLVEDIAEALIDCLSG